MQTSKFLLFPLLVGATLASAKEPTPKPAKPAEPVVVASDSADGSAYNNGWSDAAGSTGFGAWKFQESHGAGDSYAGHFIADNKTNPEKGAIAPNGKAFAFFANGPDFEVAEGFRPFSTPLKVGDTFSFQMMNPVIEQKGASDNPAGGSVGLTLRNGSTADAPDDYNKGARFEIINLKGSANYQVYDGEKNSDTGVPYSDQGVTVTVTLTGADTYDLEITRLADKKATKLAGRKLGGSGPIESFCIYNRNGEKADGFFNNFQVTSKGK